MQMGGLEPPIFLRWKCREAFMVAEAGTPRDKFRAALAEPGH
jgi:hypothetical protein